MARHEEPREDLMREATALRERAELSVTGMEEAVIVGFRAGGAGCVYVGDDLSWQFNPRGELRRGFIEGRLLKAESGRLVALTRERSASETALVRHECTAEETAALLGTCATLLDQLQAVLAAGECQLVQQVPAEGDVLGRIYDWLASLPRPLAIADTPRAGG